MTAELSWFARADRTIFELINQTFSNGFFDALMPLFATMRLWLIPLGIVWLIFFVRTKRHGRLIAVCCFLVIAATDQLSSRLIKPAVQRNRPCNVVPACRYYGDGHWITTDKFGLTVYKSSPSFPSSHATNIAGQATYWSYFYPHLAPLFVTIALLVGFSRVYVGHHWPADVAAGYLLGVVVGLLIAYPLRLWVLPEER